MRLAVLGARGMVGQELVRQAMARGYELQLLGRDTLDLSKGAADCLNAIEACDAVINCAAYTDVDKAESDEDLATQINGHALVNLAAASRARGALLVNFGTDYVFDGRATEPYATDAKRAPQTAYGRSKLIGEHALEQSGARFLQIRTSWVYASWGKNFVKTMLSLSKTRNEVKVVADQRGRPTSARYLATSTLDAVKAGLSGTYHVTDGGQTSWFEFAKEIFSRAGVDTKVVPCTTDEFPRPAPRPSYSVLCIESTERALGTTFKDWRVALAETVRDTLEQ